MIKLHLYHHDQKHALHEALWSAVFDKAVPLCLEETKGEAPPLASLEEIEISLVSDDTIARVHADFLEDPTPTDVITFHHGEIFISLDTAAEQAKEFGQSYEREVARYLVHGLLHLAGWHDEEPAEQAEMHEVQERILEAAWPTE